ncbi:hypothetical protein JCM21142_41764 [Saccharicrinis fermentans DSM 9555 = JCM 21142]|uniref:Uncharacterized protein n=1 Tax=Saccharicrinis fermentans DSM 9555 = JCM 21142 TaxID=869213 RepID=W7XXF6_9BACT|nr:hypothetical protein JCM21142_41764 [Saccharicrinis fermentans DSM 9555 = JCM 21142]
MGIKIRGVCFVNNDNYYYWIVGVSIGDVYYAFEAFVLLIYGEFSFKMKLKCNIHSSFIVERIEHFVVETANCLKMPFFEVFVLNVVF